jgi:hypothetical protein
VALLGHPNFKEFYVMKLPSVRESMRDMDRAALSPSELAACKALDALPTEARIRNAPPIRKLDYDQLIEEYRELTELRLNARDANLDREKAWRVEAELATRHLPLPSYERASLVIGPQPGFFSAVSEEVMDLLNLRINLISREWAARDAKAKAKTMKARH